MSKKMLNTKQSNNYSVSGMVSFTRVSLICYLEKFNFVESVFIFDWEEQL